MQCGLFYSFAKSCIIVLKGRHTDWVEPLAPTLNSHFTELAVGYNIDYLGSIFPCLLSFIFFLSENFGWVHLYILHYGYF